jgi:hypothetical protein
MLRIGLPVNVNGELHEGAKTLLALSQSLFDPLTLKIHDGVIATLRAERNLIGETHAMIA